MYNWRSKTLSIPCHFKILDLKTKKFKDVVDAGNLKLNFTKNAVFKTRALYTVLLLGASGETGKQLMKQLAASNQIGKIVSLGRREIPVDEDISTKIEQKVIDFDNMDKYAEEFKNAHKAFCTLGTTRGKAGKEGFIKVDHDYVLKAAELTKAGGCDEFHLMTSKGSNHNSWLLYPSTKGKVENAVKDLNFSSLYIYRPALLITERSEKRYLEGLIQWLAKAVDSTSLSWSVPVSNVARSMVVSALAPVPGVHILEHDEIVNLSKT